jgi:hypothetical protein
MHSEGPEASVKQKTLLPTRFGQSSVTLIFLRILAVYVVLFLRKLLSQIR